MTWGLGQLAPLPPLFLILCTTFYAFGDLNNPGFTIVIELDDASPAALALLKRTRAFFL